MKQLFGLLCSISLVATIGLSAACDKKKGDGEKAAAGQGAAAKKATPAAPAEKPDPAIFSAFEAVSSKCEVDLRYSSIKKCPAEEDKQLGKLLKADPAKALKTLSLLMEKGDKKARSLGCGLFYTHLKGAMAPISKNPASLSVATAKRLIKVLESTTEYPAFYCARTVVHAASIKGLQDDLYPVLEKHAIKPVRTGDGYPYLMTYGRMKAFPKIKEIAKGDKPLMIRAALRAPRNMYRATDAEKAEYCAWGKSFLTHEDIFVVQEAGRLMVRCKGEYIDALMAEAEKRLAAKEFKRPLLFVLRNICFSFIGNKGAGTEKQCEANFAFLKKVADDKSVEASVRGLSLWSIYYQRRDAKSLKLMRKYKSHKVKEIKKYANDAIKSLTTTYKLK